MAHETLHGSCSCGRNEYTIQIPDDVADHANIYFDTGRDSRQFLSSWLRVPLEWYKSHTLSFFPDETHTSIRRVFTPLNAPNTRRIFCGFCGTPLTLWTEEPSEEANFMSVSIGTLSREHQRVLEDLGLLPEVIGEEKSVTGLAKSSAVTAGSDIRPSAIVVPSLREADISRTFHHGTAGGIPWFEEMVEGSRLGLLMRQRRGMGVSRDKSTSIEWEISEWRDDGSGGLGQDSDDSNGQTTGKRKRERQVDVEASPKRA
ncbi:uncharacterized protein N7473_010263 [Penicillium subrubescens]|uniref:uncharacterized protein n=1 Tax=Penicillium subrubescens TaxID=1316194 RepID=UPI0025452D19|nr:uncharacterized protein N7473_010263 [Penicillium subrubescens]KAJ5883377.1 hypothetical protein N7473_010263 [Penicillium subrubescens]